MEREPAIGEPIRIRHGGLEAMGTRNKREAAEMFNSAAEKEWLTEAEAAGYLSVSPITLRKWRESGYAGREAATPPPCFKRGSNYYYSRRELDMWIRQGTAFYPVDHATAEHTEEVRKRRGRPRKCGTKPPEVDPEVDDPDSSAATLNSYGA